MLNKLQSLFTGRRSNAIGLDIGTENVKLAEVTIDRGRQRLLAAGLLPIPRGLMKDGRIADDSEFQELLRRLLSGSGAVSRNAILALGGTAVFTREVLFPILSERELREAVKWDMEKYVPYDPDSFYYDFAIAGTTESKLAMQVLIAAVPKRVIQTVAALVKSVGVRLLAVDIEPLALYRTLEGAANSVVLDIGGKVSQITIFRQGSPAVMRTIGIGGTSFTEAILQNCPLRFEENWEQRLPGLLAGAELPDQPSGLLNQLELIVGELIRETQLTIEYYRAQDQEAVINSLFLTGGAAKLKNLPCYFASQMDMPVLLHQPLQRLETAESIDKESLNRLSPQLAVAIGLALRGGCR